MQGGWVFVMHVYPSPPPPSMRYSTAYRALIIPSIVRSISDQQRQRRQYLFLDHPSLIDQQTNWWRPFITNHHDHPLGPQSYVP